MNQFCYYSLFQYLYFEAGLSARWHAKAACAAPQKKERKILFSCITSGTSQ